MASSYPNKPLDLDDFEVDERGGELQLGDFEVAPDHPRRLDDADALAAPPEQGPSMPAYDPMGPNLPHPDQTRLTAQARLRGMVPPPGASPRLRAMTERPVAPLAPMPTGPADIAVAPKFGGARALQPPAGVPQPEYRGEAYYGGIDQAVELVRHTPTVRADQLKSMIRHAAMTDPRLYGIAPFLDTVEGDEIINVAANMTSIENAGTLVAGGGLYALAARLAVKAPAMAKGLQTVAQLADRYYQTLMAQGAVEGVGATAEAYGAGDTEAVRRGLVNTGAAGLMIGAPVARNAPRMIRDARAQNVPGFPFSREGQRPPVEWEPPPDPYGLVEGQFPVASEPSESIAYEPVASLRRQLPPGPTRGMEAPEIARPEPSYEGEARPAGLTMDDLEIVSDKPPPSAPTMDDVDAFIDERPQVEGQFPVASEPSESIAYEPVASQGDQRKLEAMAAPRAGGAGRATWYSADAPKKVGSFGKPQRYQSRPPNTALGALRLAKDAQESVHKALSIATTSDAVKATAGLFRKAGAESDMARAKIQHVLEAADRDLEKLSKDQVTEFVSTMQRGERQTGALAKHQHHADLMRAIDDALRHEVQKRGQLRQFMENHFPNRWKNKKQAEQWLGKRLLEGGKGFAKQRKFPTFEDGIKAGFEPVSWNPVDILMQEAREMWTFISRHDALEGLKPLGLRRVVPVQGGELPTGWTYIEDPALGNVYKGDKLPVGEYVDAKLFGDLEKYARGLGIELDRLAGFGGEAGYAIPPGSYVRTKFGSSGGVLTHEIGHVLDNRFRLWDRLTEVTDAKGQKAASLKRRAKINEELRALALERYSDPTHAQASKGGTFDKYIRSRKEKVANLLDAYVNHRDIMREKAPTVLSRLEEIIAATPAMAPLKNMRPSLSFEERLKAIPVGGRILVGRVAVPKDVGELINRAVSPGLHGHSWWRAWRDIGNSVVQFKLGFSGFHAMVTGIEEGINQVAIGIERSAYGELGKASKTLVKSPFAPVTLALEGGRIRRGIKEGRLGLERQEAILKEAGGRLDQDREYASAMTKRFGRAWADFRYREGGLGAVARMVGSGPFALADLAAGPIMRRWVPSLKVGAMMRMSEVALDRLGPNATPEQVRHALGRAWDSVEDRLGQITYDNVFWNRTVKDLLQASVQSVGWNMGTIRQIAGGVVDTAMMPKRIAQHRRLKKGQLGADKLIDPIFTGRQAYIVALPVVVGAFGGLMNYLMTGEAPKELRDYYFPRTGGTDDNGDDERISLPTYMRDVWAWKTQPGQTFLHKLHPMLTALYEMLNNEDFYGTEIHHKDDPWWQEAGDLLRHFFKAYEPIPFSNLRRARQSGDSDLEQVAGFVGLGKAPRYVTASPAQQAITRYYAGQADSGEPKTKEQFEKRTAMKEAEQLYRKGRGSEAAERLREARNAGLIGPQDERTLGTRLDMSPLAGRYKGLPLETKLEVYGLADEEERRTMKPILDAAVTAFWEKAAKTKSPMQIESMKRRLRPIYSKQEAAQ